jgi:SagB-type dehydrogenase family enzyme
VVALEYHHATKHHFNRFARSLGYLDWATQPDPFRRYAGSPVLELSRGAIAIDRPYSSLYLPQSPLPLTDESIAEFLRCSMGLSAWKQHREARWALRVNPSSGNLHPTEAYIVSDARVCHYAPREHALEHRTTLDRPAWNAFARGDEGFLVALTSIEWREAWKYGERAFRYCQHDTGHAIAALRLAAAWLGWNLTLLPEWPDASVSTLLGVDRDSDYDDAEREVAECIAVVTPGDVAGWRSSDPAPLVSAARAGKWFGRANRLSTDHVPWPIIDEVSAATKYAGSSATSNSARSNLQRTPNSSTRNLSLEGINSQSVLARETFLKRRSAVAFDARSRLPRERFLGMLARTLPAAPPWDAIDWPPHVHLAVFVHRVDGLTPGVYAYLRDAAVLPEWRAAMRPEFLWESLPNGPNGPNDPNDANLFLLFPSDVMWTANRISCDQDIAADGFFSLGMIARLEASLVERGEWFYRRLFWECGMIGQILYLEAEAAGARSTGIGCFYDEAVHELLGLSGAGWQSLYHFSMGAPVDDTRLTTEPGYAWER